MKRNNQCSSTLSSSSSFYFSLSISLCHTHSPSLAFSLSLPSSPPSLSVSLSVCVCLSHFFFSFFPSLFHIHYSSYSLTFSPSLSFSLCFAVCLSVWFYFSIVLWRKILVTYASNRWQDDVVMGTLTVRENFMFSANIRLPSSVSHKEKKRRVDDTINELGLTNCADSKVRSKASLNKFNPPFSCFVWYVFNLILLRVCDSLAL